MATVSLRLTERDGVLIRFFDLSKKQGHRVSNLVSYALKMYFDYGEFVKIAGINQVKGTSRSTSLSLPNDLIKKIDEQTGTDSGGKRGLFIKSILYKCIETDPEREYFISEYDLLVMNKKPHKFSVKEEEVQDVKPQGNPNFLLDGFFPDAMKQMNKWDS